MHLRTSLAALLVALLPLAALAQSVPPDFSYQGQLLDSGGSPLPGPVNLGLGGSTYSHCQEEGRATRE